MIVPAIIMPKPIALFFSHSALSSSFTMGILSADLNALRYFIDHIISNMAHIISMARPAYITISITITFLNENKRFYKFVLSLVNRLCISDIADGLLPLHFGKHTDAGTVTGYCDFTVDDFHSVEAVVGYEQVAVKVSPVDHRFQL